MVSFEDGDLSVREQCRLLGFNRSTLYYEPVPISAETLKLMNLIDEQYTKTPFYGVRRLTKFLNNIGYEIGKDKVRTLLRIMGLEAVYPKHNTSRPCPGHIIYPYLLKGVKIIEPNQVWSADITYIRLVCGFVYLVAIIDWYSRYVLSWRLSNTLDTDFCLEVLDEALGLGRPGIFNTDQGSQFTSSDFTGRLIKAGVAISMDARGRAYDNIFIERLWRTVKYEDIYLKGYQTIRETNLGLTDYFIFYNNDRMHMALDYKTPKQIYTGVPIKSKERGDNLDITGSKKRPYNANMEDIFLLGSIEYPHISGY